MTKGSSQTESALPAMFDKKYLKQLIWPLAAEQLLAVTIGLADTLMVSVGGETAVSAVSLVDSFSQLMIALFSAFATGGAVICSQYLGSKNTERASLAGKQLYNISLAFSLSLLLLIPFRRPFLAFLFGRIDASVMENSIEYLLWMLLSYPFLAVYNSMAALYRSMGNSKISLKVSLLMNAINIGGNAILIYGFGLSVRGAGIATVLSRMAAAIVMCVLITRKDQPIHLEKLHILDWNGDMVKKILGISIPSGVENSLFQVGKLIVQNFIAVLGTASLAANAICNSIASFANIPGSALSLASITIVGQCMGAGNTGEATRYAKKMLFGTYLCMGITGLLVYLLAPQIIALFNLSTEAKGIALSVIRQCMLFTITIWPASFQLPNSLRAAGDAKFTMVVSLISMWCFRVVFAYVLALQLHLGLNGIWMGMYIDWIFRSVCFVTRFRSGKWKERQVI